MFRALTCPSSGGQVVLSQHLVSSFSVNGCIVCWMRGDCSAEYFVCFVYQSAIGITVPETHSGPSAWRFHWSGSKRRL